MPRLPKLAPGLAALALALSPAVGPAAPRPAAAQESHEPKAKAGAAHAVESTLEKIEHAEAAHEAPGEPNILEPQPALAVWTVAVFLGLLFVLGKFAWKPLLAALHQREEHLEHVLHETERARNESEKLLAEHRSRLAAAEEQIRSLLDEGRKSAQAAGDEIVRKAQAEAEASKVRAERDIGNARDQALSEIWSKTADLAVSVAGKVLDKSLTPEDHNRLVESAIRELPAANGHGGRKA
jgi:F-type H+-transporting ATPase subunit b